MAVSFPELSGADCLCPRGIFSPRSSRISSAKDSSNLASSRKSIQFRTLSVAGNETFSRNNGITLPLGSRRVRPHGNAALKRRPFGRQQRPRHNDAHKERHASISLSISTTMLLPLPKSHLSNITPKQSLLIRLSLDPLRQMLHPWLVRSCMAQEHIFPVLAALLELQSSGCSVI